MFKSAILLIIFNRPKSTQKVFEAIKNAQPDRLYIAADAPRIGNATDILNCDTTKKITENIDWPCEVSRLYQEHNLGCSLGPRAAFKWFFSFEQEGIILEDDCLPNQSFFEFTTEMLDRFRNHKQIISINGSNLGYINGGNESYFYSKYMNMWGWATWADRAKEVDYTLQSWKKIKYPLWYLHKKLSNSYFDIDIKWYKYWQHKFDLTISEKNVTWWDWQWVWHQMENKQLSIVPSVNLVSNIGFDNEATHTHEANNPAANILTSHLNKPYTFSSIIKANKIYEEHYVKWIWCYHKRTPFIKYLFSKIKRM